MINKTFEYQILNSLSPQKEALETKTFSLEIAEKAKYVVHRVIRTANKNHSQFSAFTKTKSEVRGGGRKPWKQKGTGRARAGSNRSPLWRGGGVIFGPKPRLVDAKINKKEKQLALRTLIFNKNKQFIIFNKFEFNQPKTVKFLEDLNIKNTTQRTLVISSTPNKNLQLSIRNLKNFEYILANSLNVVELTKANQIIADELSFQVIKDTYCGKI